MHTYVINNIIGLFPCILGHEGTFMVCCYVYLKLRRLTTYWYVNIDSII